MLGPTAPPRRQTEASMPISTWLAGGPKHGEHLCTESPPILEVDGVEYRHATGPYYPQGREPYQIYVLARMDEVAAAAAIRELFRSGGLANIPCDDETAGAERRRA